jgi:hypothetical protein
VFTLKNGGMMAFAGLWDVVRQAGWHMASDLHHHHHRIERTDGQDSSSNAGHPA